LSPRTLVWLLPLALVAGGSCATAQAPGPAPGPAGDAQRGEYVFAAAGCLGCHTEKGGERLAGGRGLPTPYGTFYTPNITPDPTHGIGRWSEADFFRAMREGEAPDGSSYFPAFPYTSYTAMTDQDIRDLWAHLRAQPASAKVDRPHELSAPYGWRFVMPVWKALYFEPGPLPAQPAKSEEWRRGEYLTRALGHCGECHTPRGSLGAMDNSRLMAGVPKGQGPEGDAVPNLTPHPDGLADWSPGDITTVLSMGMLPDGDFVGSGMNEVVENSTSKLTEADRRAIATYLKDIPPVPRQQ
jgi:mono/diheme cytochrome c family protein